MEKTEKLMDREIAWRIFAHEFNMSNLFISEGDERAPNYVITPTGVKCNRLFIIGVVTEIENLGKEKTLWRARLADPTGVFTIYAGQYQPEAAIFLSELQAPAYVALSGKARKYEPEGGTIYLSVRPEEINVSDERQRDRWILETAERTLERINVIENSLKSGLSGNELQDFITKENPNSAQARGMMLAIKHYENLEQTLQDLRITLAHAVETISKDSESAEQRDSEKAIPDEQVEETKIQEEIENENKNKNIEDDGTEEKESEILPKEIIAAIIDELDTGKGSSFSKIIETAQKAGLDTLTVESALKDLMDEGRCYEPKIGVIRKV